MTCTFPHTISSMSGYVVVKTRAAHGRLVFAADQGEHGATSYLNAVGEARQIHEAPGPYYARIDVRYACGCRGTL